MKEITNKLKMAFAVVKANKSVVFIDKGEFVTRYVCGMSNDEIEAITDLSYENE